MNKIKPTDIWTAQSRLPLVPYFPGLVEAATRSGSGILAREQILPIAGLPIEVVGNVLHENYLGRLREADSTSRVVHEQMFKDGHTFQCKNPYGITELGYVRFRASDTNLLPSLAERTSVFLDPIEPGSQIKLQAYEIFARQCDTDEKFADLAFASLCLNSIVKNLSKQRDVSNVDGNIISSLPKLPRISRVDSENFAVVTSKVEVGRFDIDSETIAIKSRKAGAFMLNMIESDQDQTIEALYSYDRSRGRSEELIEARQALEEILSNHPDLVHPVVESIYLCRVEEQE